MSKNNSFVFVLFAAFAAAGCSAPPDAPNTAVLGPKDPAAIKVLGEIKALPTAEARREYMASHQQETQILHGDSGAWFEASKLAWDVPGVQKSSMDASAKKGN